MEYSYTRTAIGDEWDVDVEALGVEIASGLPGVAFRINCDGTYAKVNTEIQLTPEQEANLNQIVSDHKAVGSLAIAKRHRFSEIDRRTRELICDGFEYPQGSGQRFSLSACGQARLMGLNQVRNDPNVIYPVHWNTKNDLALISLEDADQILAFYLAAVGTYRAHVDSGTSLKSLVRAATTIAEIEAVEDNR